MNWADVLADPRLRDLPGKVELDDRGDVVTRPPSVDRAVRASLAMTELLQLYGSTGHVFAAVAVQCRGGSSVIETDAAWASTAWFDNVSEEEGAAPTAPEHCVDIMQPTNTPEEMAARAQLYLGAGAVTVWVIDRTGSRTVYTRP